MNPGKKKGFALLLDAGPPKGKPKKPNDASALPADDGDNEHSEPDGDEDLSDLDDVMNDEDGDEGEGGLGDDSSGDASKIDPEAAALATRLGIHEPEKQQALIDLIQLVTGPGFGGSSATSAPATPPSLPESY